MKWFTIMPHRENAALSVNISGEIGVFASAEDFIYAIGDARDIEVTIDSTGGDSDAAIRIVAALQGRNVSTIVTGRCYSAAVPIALMGERIQAHANSTFLIHSPVEYVLGDAATLAMRARGLGKTIRTFCDIITSRTQQPREIVNSWLAKDTFFTASEALGVGLIDEIIPATMIEKPTRTESVGDAEPRKTDSEKLFADLLEALGPVETTDKAKFARDLQCWITYKVRQVPDTEISKLDAAIQQAGGF